jgi:hypothetical protein
MSIGGFWLPIFALLLPVTAAAQCAKPEMLTVWDDNSHDFKCTMPGGGSEYPVDMSKPGTTFQSSADLKEGCDAFLVNMLKQCPSGTSGAACRQRADVIHSQCLGRAGGSAGGSNGAASSGASTPTSKTSIMICQMAYRQETQACARRRQEASLAGRPPAPDTCFSDAASRRDKCLKSAFKH